LYFRLKICLKQVHFSLHDKEKLSVMLRLLFVHFRVAENKEFHYCDSSYPHSTPNEAMK
jgi:hypothetical protein